MKFLHIALGIILLTSCKTKIEKKQDNKLYSMLVNKDWAMLQGRVPLLKDLEITDSLFNFKLFTFYIDSAKNNWPAIFGYYKKAQKMADSTALPDFGYALRVFSFDTNGTVKYSIKIKNVRLVDDYFELDSGRWELKKDTLILKLKGIDNVGKFYYKKAYHLSFQDSNSMRIRLLNTLESHFTINGF
jgi:hypothetical protein